MKRMLISVDREESRAAVVKDNRLVHLEIEPVNRDSVKGNIYRGVVARVEPSLQSAFVDFGRDKQGFLPVGDIHPKLRGNNTDKRAAIQDLIRSGQEIMVQVTKDEIGNKGATLTTFISLPGRYLVLMPESEKTGVSRKLGDSARERVKDLTENMKVPEGFGLIVRTAGDSATKLELTKDLAYLNRLWSHIEKGFATGKGPAALYHERSLAIRFVRDYFRKDINEIVIDDPDTLGEVMAYLKVLMPRNVSAVERYSGVIPLFARYGIAGQVEDVFSRQVPLPSGGSIVIDQTEALVAVDVNSGRVKGKDIEETARQTNIEAAQQVARQLVLRDLGGLVVIDFIDMRDKKSVREVEAALKAAMKSDKARHKIGRISEFGLLELSRQRLKASVNKGVFEDCPHCSGTGFYRTTESVAASVMRRIHDRVAQGNVAYLVVTMPPEAANYLLNARRTELANVESAYHVSIEVIGVEGMTAAQVTVEHLQRLPKRSGAEQIREARFKRVTRKLDLVRNRLIKREETRIERKLSVEMSGASVDYAELYAGVLEDTSDIADDAPKAPKQQRRNRKRRPRGAATNKSEDQAQQQAAQAPTPAEPQQPQGFTAWLKGFFGADVKPVQPVETASEASDSKDQSANGRSNRDQRGEGKADSQQREGGRGRSRNRRRGRRNRSNESSATSTDRGQSPETIASSTESDSTHPDASRASNDAEAGEGHRRRRRRRRRGGRGRGRSEQVEAVDQSTSDQLAEPNTDLSAASDDADKSASDIDSSASPARKSESTGPDSSIDLVDIRPQLAARLAQLREQAGLEPVNGETINGVSHSDEAERDTEEASALDAESTSTDDVELADAPEDSIEAKQELSAISEGSAAEVVTEQQEPAPPSYRSVIDLRSASSDSVQP